MTKCHNCDRPRLPEGGVQMTPSAGFAPSAGACSCGAASRSRRRREYLPRISQKNSAFSDRVIFIAKCVVFLLGILITGLDVFVCRAKMPL